MMEPCEKKKTTTRQAYRKVKVTSELTCFVNDAVWKCHLARNPSDLGCLDLCKL